MYYLYLVRCRDGSLYAGITVDVNRRVAEHNASKRGAKYTRARRPVVLVYTKKYRTRSAASHAEYRLKRITRQEKIILLRTAMTRGKK